MAKRKRRNFTPEFKTKVVLETLNSQSGSSNSLPKPHDIEISVARSGCP